MTNTPLIQQQIKKLRSLNSIKKHEQIIEEIDFLSKRLNDRTFRVAVVGEFSSGKSTFINAIIGKDILKHEVTETTATITYIINVSANDSRLGTCEIEFNTGERKIIKDLEQLKEYTTVNDRLKVSEIVKSVSVYVNFLNVDYPLVIIDTPGLNGIEDKHRDITLAEIKKAHACIYLLSENGVKSSDADFFRILLNYQHRFIFIQNFLDRLRQGEETLDDKIKTDKENLNKCFDNCGESVEYRIYGVSALKALVAKDTAIKRVYSNDTEDVSDRKKLLIESRFGEFEAGLTEIINSGEYMLYVESSVIQSLLHVADALCIDIEEDQSVKEELRKQDLKHKRLEKAKSIIDNLQSDAPDKRRRLEYFIESRDLDNRKSLKAFVADKINDIYIAICAEIDSRIRNYDDFELLELAEGCSTPTFFAKKLSQSINGELSPETNKRIRENINHLYEEAILKVSDLTKMISVKEKNYDIKNESSISQYNANVTLTSKVEELKQKEVEIKNLKKQKTEIESNIKEEQSDLSEAERELRQLEVELNKIKLKAKSDEEKLGNMPQPKEKKVQKTRLVSHGGFFGWIKDIFVGKETEVYYDIERDYSVQDEWKRKRNEITENTDRLVRRLNSKMEEYQKRRDKLELDIKRKEIERASATEEIRSLESSVKNQREIYENVIKTNKHEFCETQKKKLKEDIERILVSEDNSTLQNLYKHIESMSKKNIPFIKEKVIAYYNESLNSRIKELEIIVNEGEEELKKQYEVNKKDLLVLESVLEKLKGALI